MSVATTTTLMVSPEPSVFGGAVQLVALVPEAGADAIGIVTFKEGLTVLGTAPIGNGQASISVSSLTAGTHTLTAEFGSDPNYFASNSVSVAHVVSQAQVTVVLSAGAPAWIAGQPITLRAVVTPTTTGATPVVGTVTFKEGTTALGTGSVGTDGVATFTTSALLAGPHTVTADFSGSTNFAAASAATPLELRLLAATTADLVSAEDALHAWAVAALGLEAIWSNPNDVAPYRPFAWLTLTGPVRVGEPQFTSETNTANPAGQEVEVTMGQHGEWTFTVEVITAVTSGAGSARALLSAAAIRMRLPSMVEALATAGLAVVGFGDTQDLTALFATAFESRARLTVRLRGVNTATEKTGYIDTVGISSPFGTWPQLPP